MLMNEYIKSVLRSESASFHNLNARILHGVLGCVTESGELADAVKKSLFYGRTLDIANVKEELGDVLWYVALIIDELGSSFDEITDMNIAKLKARYPQQFSCTDANNRNISAEITAMKESSDG